MGYNSNRSGCFFIYASNFMSPNWIHPAFRMISLAAREITAGSTMHVRISPTHVIGDVPVSVMMPMGPTMPQVPMPAETPVHFSWNTIVEMGPQMAEARVGGIQIWGLRQILPI